jgi:putative ATP-dependent endonuclease of OLD family
MRLAHVLIEDFRGIGRLELSLDRLTVVIGENNHGKSSLLDVLERCLGRPDAPAPTHFEPSDFRRTSAPTPAPIRVLLTFHREETAGHGGEHPGVFDMATVRDPQGRGVVRAEFTGDPATGAMRARFVDAAEEPLDPQPHAIVLSRLRHLHPVLVVRLAQPHAHVPLEWSRAQDREEGETSERHAEQDIARVYRRLAEARGPVPPEDVRRALQSAHRLRTTLVERYLSEPGSLAGVLDPLVEDGARGGRSGRPHPGSGSHALGLLLVLGALIDVRGDAVLSPDAEPLLAIEEPEVHLHPMLVASTWDVIEKLRAQALVITNSGEFLSNVPLPFLRRLVRRDGRIDAHSLRERTLSPEGMRRVGYHIRAKRGSALFARCWLLVEGETEFWLVRQLAQVLGYDLESEGVRCVEFAQCGVEPLVKLADDLRIEWHLLSDGDDSGASYAREARTYLGSRPAKRHVTRLRRRNVELELWYGGFADVYRRAAGLPEDGSTPVDGKKLNAHHIVTRAIRRHSKPYLALTVAEESTRRGPESIPGSLRHVIETSVRLARNAIDDGSRSTREVVTPPSSGP